MGDNGIVNGSNPSRPVMTLGNIDDLLSSMVSLIIGSDAGISHNRNTLVLRQGEPERATS